MTEKKPLIMIADDEEDIKVILKAYLESTGFEVVTAYDGLNAIATAKENKPDLILMDIMMPVIDGVEATKQLKAQEETRDIPVVMLSAVAQSGMIEKAVEAGAADYISKPFEPVTVKEVIEGILQGTQ